MRIAVASGKGGTGKTTVAVNFSLFLAGEGKRVHYIDCDVEEPNGHLFLKPVITTEYRAGVVVPVIDESRCDGCGTCVSVCQYNALVRLGKTVMIFPELCHGCGGCMRFCPKKAVTETTRHIGMVQKGMSGWIRCSGGTLAIGEAMSPPLIREVLRSADDADISILDAPPGTSCPVVNVVRNADMVVLVTEPTPFGLHDLGLAIDMVREMQKPFGVVINRDTSECDNADRFCREQGASIFARIPDERKLAEVYSRGEMFLDVYPGYRPLFAQLQNAVENRRMP